MQILLGKDKNLMISMPSNNFYIQTHISFLKLPFPRQGRNQVSGQQQQLLYQEGQEDCTALSCRLPAPLAKTPRSPARTPTGIPR